MLRNLSVAGDDHALVRQGFRRLLEDEPDIVVVGEAGDGLDAVKLRRNLDSSYRYGCALPASAAWSPRSHLEALPDVAILMTDMHWGNLVRQALDAGRSRIHSQKRHGTRTSRCHSQSGCGKNVGDPASRDRCPQSERNAALTPRELEILVDRRRQINKEIADQLVLVANTSRFIAPTSWTLFGISPKLLSGGLRHSQWVVNIP